MAVSIGVWDMVMLIQLLEGVTQHLKEAPDDYRRAVDTFESFVLLARHLEAHAPTGDSDAALAFHSLRQKIEEVLTTYFKKLELFEDYLGDGRIEANQLMEMVARIGWARHRRTVEDLQQELDRLTNRIGTVAAVSAAARPPPGFWLEDARGRRSRIAFDKVPNWEDLHCHIVSIFDGRPGLTAVKNRSYLLHNATTDRAVLQFSPYRGNLCDVIHENDVVRMSVVFPHESWHDTVCPKCEEKWPARDRSYARVTCSNCGLWVHFLNSNDDAPDGITQLVLDDMTLMRGPAIVDEINEDVFGAEGGQDKIRGSLAHSIPIIDAAVIDDATGIAPSIEDFKRVTLCVTRWPDLADTLQAWSKTQGRASELVADVNRLAAQVQEARSPLETAETLLQFEPGLFRMFLEAMVPRCQKREPGLSESLCRTLQSHARDAHNSARTRPLDRDSVKARCFLWLIKDALEADSLVLGRCAQLARCLCEFLFGPALNIPKSGLFEKAFKTLFIPHLVIFRAMEFVREGAQHLIISNRPRAPFALVAFLLLLSNSRSLCLEHAVRGSLEGHKFDQCDLGLPVVERLIERSTHTGDRWSAAFRKFLESVIEAGGTQFVAPQKFLPSSEDSASLLF